MANVGIRDFANAVWGDYWARMSGPASVPAAVLALWLSNDIAKIAFALTAFVCAWITAYRVWKPEREKILLLPRFLSAALNSNCLSIRTTLDAFGAIRLLACR